MSYIGNHQYKLNNLSRTWTVSGHLVIIFNCIKCLIVHVLSSSFFFANTCVTLLACYNMLPHPAGHTLIQLTHVLSNSCENISVMFHCSINLFVFFFKAAFLDLKDRCVRFKKAEARNSKLEGELGFELENP